MKKYWFDGREATEFKAALFWELFIMMEEGERLPALEIQVGNYLLRLPPCAENWELLGEFIERSKRE